MTAAELSLTPPRITASKYAAKRGLHYETVMRWCRNMLLGEQRNKRMPAMVARKVGRDWRIDEAATEHMQAVSSGNPIERDLARKS